MTSKFKSLLKGPYQQLIRVSERWRYRTLWDDQLSFQQANAAIVRLLLQDQPCLVGRIGHTEGRIVGEALFRGGCFGRLTKKEAHQYSGIFPVTPDALSHFAEIYRAAITQVDLLGFWQTTFQARLVANCGQAAQLAPLPALEPYLHPNPWTATLAGRRVLVVHPFYASILEQYREKRQMLFANPLVLPDFELQVVAPPQTLAPMTGGYATWQDALDRLVDRVLQQEFDVALLGCGAYGLPLGAAIKAAGKQAIHLGGALQVLFGIRGRRWEKIPSIASLMNEQWVRASKEETPISASLVDQACYW
jgi:hypothetical protein